jgi:hypothetical protein
MDARAIVVGLVDVRGRRVVLDVERLYRCFRRRRRTGRQLGDRARPRHAHRARRFERQIERERAPFAGRARELDFAAEQLRQLAADREA